MKKIFFIVAAVAAFAVSCRNSAGEAAPAEGCEPAPAKTSELREVMSDVTILSDTTSEDGVRSLSVLPSDVCSQQIDIKAKEGIILSVKFYGGCPGNTQGVAKLVAGMPVAEAVAQLEGIDCGGRGTSCPDQLAKALKVLLY